MLFQMNLLKMMTSADPDKRPSTIGIRAFLPSVFNPDEETENKDYHFEMPVIKSDDMKKPKALCVPCIQEP